MELRQEHSPGGKPLFLTYIRDYPKVSQFYCWDPRTDFSPLLNELERCGYFRQELAALASAQSPQTSERLTEWVQQQGLAVRQGRERELFTSWRKAFHPYI